MSPRTPEQSEKIREERREQILRAALQIFAEKGYHSARVSDVAARAGVSQGTIYWYFKSKEALFGAAFMSQVDALFEPINRILDQDLPAGTRLLRAVEMSLDLMSTEIGFFQLLIRALSVPEVADLLADDFQRLYMQFKERIVPLLREVGDPDPETAASLFMAVLDGLGFQYVIHPALFDRARVLKQIEAKFNLSS